MIEAGSFVTTVEDCDALLIPSATPITIPKDTEVQITQAMGGSITVVVGGNLARIEQQHATALGIDPTELNAPILQTKQSNKEVSGPVNIDDVWDALRTCYDPEIPVNIVDLGLIYECKATASSDGKHNLVEIKMTLTAPGCGMGPVIVSDAEERVIQVENVSEVKIELVFEPVWNQDMMSDAAKLELGLL